MRGKSIKSKFYRSIENDKLTVCIVYDYTSKDVHIKMSHLELRTTGARLLKLCAQHGRNLMGESP